MTTDAFAYVDLELTFPDLAPLVTPDYAPDLTLSERFAEFHKANPIVADTFERLIGEWLAAGNDRVGMKAIAERARWESGLRMPGEAWAINNSLVSRYARLMVQRHPEWADAIETRTLRAA